jgi:uncharacterized zinc-type alcohol dehydrogenase-like protein
VRQRSTEATAYAAQSARALLAPTTITRRAPTAQDVAIDIAYAGICHSDIHTVRDEWGAANYPLVPGHEITGHVIAVGSDVTDFAVGDRVGVGVMVDSCRHCEPCLAGEENYCDEGMTDTYNSRDKYGEITQGGYSTSIVTDQHWVYAIPQSLDLAAAAPLLCAGITVYSPLKHWNIGPGSQVAVVGLGGLGHLGVKFAAALGAEVTVLSQSLGKKEDGLRMGASHYHATSDPETFKVLRRRFDLILNTVSANLDLDLYLDLVARGGTFVELGVPVEPLSFKTSNLVAPRVSVSGSMIGGVRETQEMLEFAADHQIATEIELIDADHINEAYDRIVASNVRYRFVIDVSSMR